jgi:hypothetical protein
MRTAQALEKKQSGQKCWTPMSGADLAAAALCIPSPRTNGDETETKVEGIEAVTI